MMIKKTIVRYGFCLLLIVAAVSCSETTASEKEDVKTSKVTSETEKLAKKITEEVDDVVVVVVGQKSSNDDDEAEVVEAAEKSGRAILVDGVPVDNSAPNTPGFKLLKAEDVDKSEGRIKVVDSIPTDASEAGSAGFRLPLPIEVLVLDVDDEFAPSGRKLDNATSTEDDDEFIVIEVGVNDNVNDFDCFAERETGNCNKTEEAFFFDSQTGKCSFFIYSGCGGNTNRFSSEAECELKCQDAKTEGSQKKKQCGSAAPVCEKGCNLVQGEECLECDCTKIDPAVCLEPSGLRGHCRAILPYWTFNSEKKACEEFTFGGCDAGASNNRFKTKDICESTCLKTKDEV